MQVEKLSDEGKINRNQLERRGGVSQVCWLNKWKG